MTLMYLVRHGRSVWNAAGRIQGQIDIELDKIGLQQAQRIADRLEREPIAAIYSSPLRRAGSTAEAIAARFDLPVRPDAPTLFVFMAPAQNRPLNGPSGGSVARAA